MFCRPDDGNHGDDDDNDNYDDDHSRKRCLQQSFPKDKKTNQFSKKDLWRTISRYKYPVAGIKLWKSYVFVRAGMSDREKLLKNLPAICCLILGHCGFRGQRGHGGQRGQRWHCGHGGQWKRKQRQCVNLTNLCICCLLQCCPSRPCRWRDHHCIGLTWQHIRASAVFCRHVPYVPHPVFIIVLILDSSLWLILTTPYYYYHNNHISDDNKSVNDSMQA